MNLFFLSYIAYGICTLFNGTQVIGNENLICAECDWSGWINASNHCVTSLSVTPRLNQSILSITSPSLHCFEDDHKFVPSVFGIRCKECSYIGYLINSTSCHCYDTTRDGTRQCRLMPELTEQNNKTFTELISIHVQTDSVACEPFQNKHGYFKNATMSQIKPYGEEYPFTPKECCSSVYGPPPGQLVETDPSKEFQECNTFGSFDPDEIAIHSAFRTCSGHGKWNPNLYECECYNKWNAMNIGVECNNASNPVYSCKTCFGFWGPEPPLHDPLLEVEMLHCSVPFTPDPETGELRECSGHGSWRDNMCVCDYNDQDGYWSLAQARGLFQRVFGNGTIVHEWHEIDVCSVNVQGKDATTLTPSNSNQQTHQPTTHSCDGCGFYGNMALNAATYIVIDTPVVPNVTHCCTVSNISFVGDKIEILSGTCLQSTATLSYLGSKWCEVIQDCYVYSWSMINQVITFKFTNEEDFTLLVSASSGSGLPCPPTPQPTYEPTAYPTPYPSSFL